MLVLGNLLPAPTLAPSSRPTIRSARSRNRAAAWRHDLAQWYRYELSRALGEDRRAEIDAEYERLLASGPDFTAYHTGSSFVDPPVDVVTREDRIKALAAFDFIAGGIYRHCRAPRGQGISPRYKAVFAVLLSYAVKHRTVYPTLETIARAAVCSKSTVLAALGWLERFGLLQRLRRLVRVPGLLGPRVRQTSNAYRLQTRLSGLSGLALGVFRGLSRNKSTPFNP